MGVISAGIAVSMNSPATAAGRTVGSPVTVQDWGGGWNDQRDVSIREKPSTTARKVGTLKKGHRVKCWVSGCSAVQGGSYRCTSSSPTGHQWHEVRWNGKKAYAATDCLEWGRIE